MVILYTDIQFDNQSVKSRIVIAPLGAPMATRAPVCRHLLLSVGRRLMGTQHTRLMH